MQTTFDYCRKNSLLGVGWRTPSGNHTKDWATYFSEASKTYGNLHVQAQHLAVLRALRESISTGKTPELDIPEDQYWVRLKEKEVVPIGKLELIELFSSDKVGMDSELPLTSRAAYL
jgi:hypothetical protein